MGITELIEQLKAMPKKMEGYNSEGELVALNTHKLAESLNKSLRNCDVGTANEQIERHEKWCNSDRCVYGNCGECFAEWLQMTYKEAKGKAK